jgi:hypothetical protein
MLLCARVTHSHVQGRQFSREILAPGPRDVVVGPGSLISLEVLT